MQEYTSIDIVDLMATNVTESADPGKGGTVAIAVIVPAVFVIVLLMLVLT